QALPLLSRAVVCPPHVFTPPPMPLQQPPHLPPGHGARIQTSVCVTPPRAAGCIARLRATSVAVAFVMVALVAACTSREETSSGPARTTTTVAAAPNPVASAEFGGVAARAAFHQQEGTAWRGSPHHLAVHGVDATP